jgi:hypothetical protein
MENRPGMLAQVADALGAKKVNIRAFMASAMDGRGFLRLVVDRPAVAKKVFAQHGWKTSAEELVEVTVPDRPGALARVAERLGAAGVNIEYAYLGTAGRAGKVNLYLSVADARAALRALR